MSSTNLRSQLGELLVEMGLTTPDAVTEAESVPRPLIKVLAEDHQLNEERTTKAVASRLGLEIVDVSELRVHPKVLDRLPVSFCKQHGVLPFAVKLESGKEILYLVVSDPYAVDIFDDANRMSGCEVRIALAPATEIEDSLARIYSEALTQTREPSYIPPSSSPFAESTPNPVTAPMDSTTLVTARPRPQEPVIAPQDSSSLDLPATQTPNEPPPKPHQQPVGKLEDLSSDLLQGNTIPDNDTIQDLKLPASWRASLRNDEEPPTDRYPMRPQLAELMPEIERVPPPEASPSKPDTQSQAAAVAPESARSASERHRPPISSSLIVGALELPVLNSGSDHPFAMEVPPDLQTESEFCAVDLSVGFRATFKGPLVAVAQFPKDRAGNLVSITDIPANQTELDLRSTWPQYEVETEEEVPGSKNTESLQEVEAELIEVSTSDLVSPASPRQNEEAEAQLVKRFLENGLLSTSDERKLLLALGRVLLRKGLVSTTEVLDELN